MSRDQRIVFAGAASGIAAMALAMWRLPLILPSPDVPDIAARLAYALRWDVVAALPLFAAIVTVGNGRFFGPAIDPTQGAEDEKMRIDVRVVDNSLQQFALFLVATLALAAELPPPRLNAIAAASITFVAARLAFWIGYRIGPLYRAPGFAATAWLNAGLFAVALWLGFA
jgi:hypothetical protein